VTIGTGDGGDTGIDRGDLRKRTLVSILESSEQRDPANEFIVHSVITAESDFYVKSTNVLGGS
jgi:hypothetical protein